MHLVGKVSLVPPIRSSRTSIFSSFASLLCFRNRFVLRGSFSLRRTMKSHVQFLGQSSPEGPPTLIIHYDKHRYMFNCREGTQRLCVEERVRLSKLNSIFFTRVQWGCMGGMFGMLLTLADAGVRKLDIYGGKNLTHSLAAARSFVYRTNFEINAHELTCSGMSADDGNLKAMAVVVLPTKGRYAGAKRPRSPSPAESTSEEHDQEFRQNVLKQMFDKKSPAPTALDAACEPLENSRYRDTRYMSQQLPRTRRCPAALTYICHGPTRKGKFDPNAAKALGVKPGPLFGRLQRGETISLEDGSAVQPDQVMAPDIPGHIFIVVDCPNVDYIDGLLASREFDSYQDTTDTARQPKLVVHLIGDDVLQDPRYQEWMNRFSTSTEHVVSSERVCAQPVLFRSHAVSQLKLSQLDDEIFPVPYYNNLPSEPLPEGLRATACRNMLKFQLEPKAGFAKDDAVIFDHLSHPDETSPEYKEAVVRARQAAGSKPVDAFPGDKVHIVTLGTGSSLPAKYRNVSATLVKIPGFGSIMLDAGEGTLGQMMRRFGDALDDELNAIRCIFVSHLHADHHLGVIQLLRRHRQEKPVHVIAPRVFENWLREYSDVEQFATNMHVIQNEHILPGKEPHGYVLESLDQLRQALGLQAVNAVEVVHCRWAYGLSVTHASGWKLVYSGDTRPCDSLVRAGQDATLLIHEATMEDGMQAEARTKRHATVGEAIDMGKKMNARFTLLNHFSQRYPKVPTLSDDHNNACFSFDLMSVNIQQLAFLPKYTEAIRLLFNETAQADEDESGQ